MKKNGLSHIRKWLWVYVFLVVMITFAVFTFVYNEISETLYTHSWNAELNQSKNPASSSASISGARLRVLLLLTIGLLAIVFFSIIWLRTTVRQISRPIRSIQLAVFRLAQGKLNETVTIQSTDEFGQIGLSINELAANLQELLLYIWKQTGQCITTLEQMKSLPEFQKRECLSGAADEHLRELTKTIESLRELAKFYVFYDVSLEGEKAVAIGQPGQKKTIHPPSFS